MKYDADVLIIGAGIGGVATGALLAHGGRRVMLIERNPFLGGRCTSYEKEGFIIDVFAHMFGRCEKGPFGEIMKRVGRPEVLKFWHASPKSRPLLLIDGKPYPCLSSSFSTREEQAETLKVFGLTDEDVETAFRINGIMLDMNYEDTFSLDNVPYSQWLKQFTSNKIYLALEHNKALILSVVTLKEASAGEFIRMAKNYEKDAYIGYPIGGCIRIPKVMADVIGDNGGEVLTSTPVERIIVENGIARGVKLEDGMELTAPLVISNAGIRETVAKLVGEESLPQDYVQRVKSLTTGKLAEETPMGIIYMKLALDKPVIAAPLIFFNVKEGAMEGMREFMFNLIADRPPANYKGINTFIPVTTNMDPGLGPEGKQLVNFYGMAPPESKNMQAWIDFHLGFLFGIYPEIEKHVLWYDFSTSNRIRQFSGRMFSDVIGISQSVGQTGKNRPAIVTPIEGLYMVGSDVGNDNIGTELAAESALRLAKMLQ